MEECETQDIAVLIVRGCWKSALIVVSPSCLIYALFEGWHSCSLKCVD